MAHVATVRSVAGKRYQQTVEAGHHRFVCDEPEYAGGDDAGPAPYDLLLGALGACTSMTAQMYAERKEWPLEAVEVELTHERVPFVECEGCARPEGATDKTMVDRFTRAITLRGPLSAEQRERILEIANKCPVHRTLSGTIRIVSHLVEPKPAEPTAPPTEDDWDLSL